VRLGTFSGVGVHSSPPKALKEAVVNSNSFEQMSDLEQGVEMELEADGGDDDSLREAFEEREYEGDGDGAAELESDEGEFESSLEEDRERTYGDRLASLADREFENDRELETAVREVFDDMEREYFFKRFKNLVSGGGRALLRRAVALSKNTPFGSVVKNVTSLARGNLKGLLTSLAKNALASAVPGGALIAPLLSSLSKGKMGDALHSVQRGLADSTFEAEREFGGDENTQNQLTRVAEVAQSAFEELAGRINENATEPIEASRLAHASLEAAMRKHTAPRHKRTRHITLGPGERLVITRR
jgi:hypothetical protein